MDVGECPCACECLHGCMGIYIFFLQLVFMCGCHGYRSASKHASQFVVLCVVIRCCFVYRNHPSNDHPGCTGSSRKFASEDMSV